MAKFKFIGDIETTFLHLIHAGDEEHTEGSTVVAKPGEEFDVSTVTNPAAVLNPDLEAIDDDAKKIVADAEEKARLEGARVFGDVATDAGKVEAEAEKLETEVAPPAAPTEPAPAPAPEATPPAS